MGNIKNLPLPPEKQIIAEAKQQNIPVEKYSQILLEKKAADYLRQELMKSVNYLITSKMDKDTYKLNIEIIADKLIKIIKHELKSELLKENWRIS